MLYFRVVAINVISIGNKLFINAIKFSIEDFTIVIISEKFFMIIVTISIYVT